MRPEKHKSEIRKRLETSGDPERRKLLPAAMIKAAKYGNIKTVVDGIKFDSKKEAKRYGILKVLEKSGLISDLRLQCSYDLRVGSIIVCRYVADFVYEEKGKVVVEDVKGFRTREFILKKRLMLAIHGIQIKEI